MRAFLLSALLASPAAAIGPTVVDPNCPNCPVPPDAPPVQPAPGSRALTAPPAQPGQPQPQPRRTPAAPPPAGQDGLDRAPGVQWLDRTLGESEPARRDFGRRLAESLGNPALAAQITEWASKPENRSLAALLYYGVGVGAERPQWAGGLDDQLYRQIGPGTPDFRDRIAAALEQILGGRPTPEAIARLLQDEEGRSRLQRAVNQALMPGVPGQGPGQGDREGQPPPVQGGPQRPRETDAERRARSNWNAAEMYGVWGDPNVYSVDGRVISFNVVTVKESDGPPPVMRQKVAIYDVTDPANIYGRTFDIDVLRHGQPLTFRLEDRVPGTQAYTFQLVAAGNDTKIVFQTAEGKTPINGQGRTEAPTVNELFRERARKVREYGYVVKVGDREYYLGAEGHSNLGQNTFWSKELLDKIDNPDFNAREFLPDHVAVTTKVENGSAIRQDQTKIGFVNGKWYDLRWNPERRIMEAVEGQPPPLPPAQPGAPQQPAPGQPPGSTPVDADGWPILQTFTPVPAMNAKLSIPNARFYINPNGPPGQQLLMMFDKDIRKIGFVPYYATGGASRAIGQDILTDSTGRGHILVSQSDQGFMYVDLRQGIQMEQLPGGQASVRYGLVGAYNPAGGGNAIQNVKDLQVLGDILRRAGYSDTQAQTIRENLSRGLRERNLTAFDLSGAAAGATGGILTFPSGSDAIRVWPDYAVVPGGATPTQPPVPTQPQGIAFDSPRGFGPFDGFRALTIDSIQASPMTTVTSADAALYETTRENKKRWHLSFAITASGGSRYVPTAPILVFEEGAARVTLPAGVQIGGITYPAAILPAANQFRIEIPAAYRDAQLSTRGAIAVFDAPSGRAPNCVGVVAWWGVTREAALSACGAR